LVFAGGGGAFPAGGSGVETARQKQRRAQLNPIAIRIAKVKSAPGQSSSRGANLFFSFLNLNLNPNLNPFLSFRKEIRIKIRIKIKKRHSVTLSPADGIGSFSGARSQSSQSLRQAGPENFLRAAGRMARNLSYSTANDRRLVLEVLFRSD
jgi:hypothetical protein